MSEQYNGWANRETWAFNLHWQNDQGFYNEVLDFARQAIEEAKLTNHGETPNAYTLGERVVDHVEEMLAEGVFDLDAERMIRDDVGSWWRIDCEETGKAVLQSLDIESD